MQRNKSKSRNHSQKPKSKSLSKNSKGNQSNRPSKPNKLNRSNKSNKSNKFNRSNKSNKSDKSNKLNKSVNQSQKNFKKSKDHNQEKGKKSLSKNKSMKYKPNKNHQQMEQQQNDHEHHQNQNQFNKARLFKMPQKEQMQLIQQTFHQITLDPETKIKQIQKLFIMSKTSNLKVVASAILTLAQLFVNIAPLQPVNINDITKRMAVTITKDQFKILKFQKILVQQYQRYIKTLKELNLKLKKSDFQNNLDIYKKFKKCIFTCLQKCFDSLWHFNAIKELLDIYVKFYHIESCQSSMKQFLASKNIATMPVKSKLISSLAQIIIKRPQNSLPDKLLSIINNTQIDTKFLEKDRQSLEYKKKQMKKRLYKQQAFEKKKQKQKHVQSGTLQMKRRKKQQKAMEKLKIKQQVQKQFAEAEAVMSNKELIKYTSSILQELFYIYFKILVDKQNSKFLRDALDGVLKFSHMINIQLIVSLVQNLDTAGQFYRQLWKQRKDPKIMQTRLLIVFTAESVLNGPLSVYNMDDLKQTKNFYKILKDINSTQKPSSLNKKSSSSSSSLKYTIEVTRQIFRLIIITIQQSFIKRRQLSQETVASILRQLAILATRKNIPKMVLIDTIRLLCSRYNKVIKMLQEDNQGFGINSFNQMSQDPQSTNAINTSINNFLKQALYNCDDYDKHSIINLIQALLKQNFITAVKDKLPFDQMFEKDLNSFKD